MLNKKMIKNKETSFCIMFNGQTKLVQVKRKEFTQEELKCLKYLVEEFEEWRRLKNTRL